jgi:hypothetical protein
MQKVRSRAGTPTASDFSSADGSPLVQDNQTGQWWGYANSTPYPLSAVNVRSYGAKGDGVTDDRAALQAAITANDELNFPPGTYAISSALTVTTSNKRIYGAGRGITTILNTGTGNALEVKSLGGVSPTILKISVSDLTIEGNTNSLSGLYTYDVADSTFERIESKSNGSHGILAEMNVDNAFSDCYCHANEGDGFKLSAALKNSVEFTSNAVLLDRIVTLGNDGAALRISRSHGNLVSMGDYASSADGIVLEGSYRNNLHAVWIENNATDNYRVEQSTSPTTINSDSNRLHDCNLSGTGNITISNGDRNSFIGNYVSGDVTISGAGNTTRTYITPDNRLIGTVTDNGNDTVNLRNPSDMYWKASGLKRLQIAVGSTVDFTSDIQALRFAQVKGISSTSTQANNLRGQETFASAATKAVTFGTAEANASYFITVAGNVDERFWVTSKGTGGFTLNSSNATSTAVVDWHLIR